jgi:hypothetical protein
VFVRVGRGVAALTFVDTLTPFDAGLREDLTRKGTRRLTTGIS